MVVGSRSVISVQIVVAADKLPGSQYRSEEGRGAQPEPWGSRELAAQADSLPGAGPPPSEGRRGQRGVLEAVRKAQRKPVQQGL